jgi:hypothetical protein
LNTTDAVLDGLPEIRSWQEALYRDVHQHPELSHQELRTAQLIADKLRSWNFEVHEGVGGTGVVGVLRNGDGPSVLLRDCCVPTWTGYPCKKPPDSRMPARSARLALPAMTCR